MTKFFDSAPVKNVINKLLLVFIFYTVAAASFNGFFVKWSFLDNEKFDKNSFSNMYDEKAHRPFVHRQLMFTVAKKIKSAMPEESQKDFLKFLKQNDFLTNFFEKGTYIEYYYGNTKIEPRFAIEYHIIYFMSFAFLFFSMFLWRQIGFEITGNLTAGTLTACVFAIIFPIFETIGGYSYDFGEIFFISLATFLAIKSYWLLLILISPIAEYNKESFLFFLATLFPLMSVKLGNKKTFLTIATAIFLSGLVYLYVKSLYIGNDGTSTEFHLLEHLEYIFIGWTDVEITYGVFFGKGSFLPHILIIAWIFKCTWSKIPLIWKNHIKIAALINFTLYFLLCASGELRNLSLLYIGFITMLSIFIKELIFIEQKK